jgi:hypothetical protein
MRHIPGILAVAAALAACNGQNQERPEQVKKLRAVGVATCAGLVGAAACASAVGEPSTTDASQAYTLTIVAALPLGSTVDVAEPFVEPGPPRGLPGSLTVDASTAKYENHKAFRLYSVQATVPIPTAETLKIDPALGYASMLYGVHLAGPSGDQKIEGKLLVYPHGDPALVWTAPTVDIANPTDGAAVSGDQDLKGSADSASGENLRVGWYVDDGEIKNRRAISTSWTKAPAGNHTLLLTVRGLKSGTFAYKAVDVTVQ